jgi:hexosaminidase
MKTSPHTQNGTAADKNNYPGEASSYLLGIPTVPFSTTSPDSTFDLTKLEAIVVDIRYLTSKDEDGLTLIPPTLWDFAETFRSDLAGIDVNTVLVPGVEALPRTLFLTLEDDKSLFRDAAGRETSEGYALTVTSETVTVSGASALGAWWGTRTVLQQALLNDKKMKLGKGIDSPGWSERGMMVSLQGCS